MTFAEIARRYRTLRTSPLLYTRDEAKRFARGQGRRVHMCGPTCTMCVTGNPYVRTF